MPHLIHNLMHVWAKPLQYEFLPLLYVLCTVLITLSRAIILNNWFLNPTGKPFSWVEVDLMQEHMNFWIKVRGSLRPARHIPLTTHVLFTRPMTVLHPGNGSQWLPRALSLSVSFQHQSSTSSGLAKA
jgi:hypothetical protein